jgi:hypothetical protein
LQAAKTLWLYVATTDNVFLVDVTVKDKEVRSELDNLGCEKGGLPFYNFYSFLGHITKLPFSLCLQKL